MRGKSACGTPPASRPSWSRPASFTTGLHDWQAKWIAAPTPAASLVLRREFTVKPGLRRATAIVCGLGQYELTLNGRKAGDDLWPGLDEIRQDLPLRHPRHHGPAPPKGQCGRLFLGNGMYNVRGGRYTKFMAPSAPPKAIAQVRLEYADGTAEVVGTDEHWRAARPHHLLLIYGGEDYDARIATRGWDRRSREVVGGPGGELRGLSCAAPPIRAFEVFGPLRPSLSRRGGL